MEDYNNRMREYITDLVKQEVIALGETKKKDSRGTVRDYKKEYAKYGSSKKAKKYRAELNKYNRQKGTYGNGDGKDASHKGGKIVGFESQSKNRGRAEKSRLKKEELVVENPIVAATVMNMTKMHMTNPQTGRKIKASTPLRDKDHPLHDKSVSIFQKIKDKLTKKKEKPLSKADQYKALMKKQKDADFYRKQYTGESVNEDINDKMKTTMTKLAKSLGIKSVVSMHTGKGSLSYFIDDDREAKKLQKFLQRSFKRVRLISLDKSKGDTANWVVAADMLGLESVNEAKYKGYDYKRQNRKYGLPLIVPALRKTFANMKDLKKYIDKHGTMESVNESEQDKIKQHLMKKGDNEQDATEKLKYYDMVTKMYKGANSTKKAEIMSSLWANEAVNNPSFFDGESINERFRPSDRKTLMVVVRDTINKLRKKNPDIDRPDRQLGQALNAILRAMTREKSDRNYRQYKKYFPKYNDKLLRRLASAYFDEPYNVQNTFMRDAMKYSFKESVNEVNMAHVLSKDLSKKKFKDLGLYLWHVLDLDINKDFRLTSNGKLLAINVDKIKKNSLKNIKKRFGVDLEQLAKESVNEGVSKSQAQEIMNQLGGRKFEMLMGVKSKGIGKDGLILHIGKNPKRVSHIIIDLDRGRDLYNLTFGKIVKYQFKVIKKLKGIYVDQLHDMIEKYTGNLTTFRPRR